MTFQSTIMNHLRTCVYIVHTSKTFAFKYVIINAIFLFVVNEKWCCLLLYIFIYNYNKLHNHKNYITNIS